jgi:diphthine-ammonia ligase
VCGFDLLKFTWMSFSIEMQHCLSGYCRAFVEVKPILFVPEDAETAVTSVQNPSSFTVANRWGFQHARWHDSCIQKCVVSGKICAIILSITENIVVKICSESLGVNDEDVDHQNSVSKGHMERVLRFCVYLLDKVIMENGFSWEDTMVSFLYSFLKQLIIP